MPQTASVVGLPPFEEKNFMFLNNFEDTQLLQLQISEMSPTTRDQRIQATKDDVKYLLEEP